ncbi:hypothetical protein [Tsuneonella dongtanensis]|uniref:hypothetical protein n=1 Tax=Tsuneonella dongtanensis TaxID=692370 RepID=UPI0012EE3638|nr:hypothetical protein [Tsuneonella dongtanensis]
MRDRVVGWHTGLRARGTLSLFAFEFFVVVLGVLAAQAVQSWVQDREQRLHAEAEQARLEQGFIQSRQSAQVWRAALPCLRDRVREVMRIAGSGALLDNAQSRRPKLVQSTYPGVSPETSRLIEQRIGPQQTGILLATQARFDTVKLAADEIRVEWEMFRLLDPDFGQTGSADRAAVRASGAAILNSLRTIEVVLDAIEDQARLTDVRPNIPFDRQVGLMPVRNCDEIWAQGAAYRTIEPGEPSPY